MRIFDKIENSFRDNLEEITNPKRESVSHFKHKAHPTK